ncbi:MAG TPA: hypothetical protein PLC80_16500 [Draconibacterium sp.]|nr:hypothetical protein [Draconibacterium sp.]
MKKTNYYKLVWLLLTQLFLVAGFASNGQQNETFKLDNVTEKIVLNTDRDIYFAGEQLLFSAQYFINQIKTNPVISNVIYVELINCADKNSVVQKKFETRDFMANGIINIPKDAASGSYVVRAYTQYQRNFGYLGFTCHFITVINPENNKKVFVPDENADSVEIVPEANILLDKVRNNVVIRIPASFIQVGNKYFVADKELNVIENVEAPKNGLAEVEIVGNQQESYNFVIRKSNGAQIVKAFPKTESKGIQTQIRQTETNVDYFVQTKGFEQMQGNLDYQIKVLSNDLRVKYSKNINLGNSSVSNKIKSEVFGEGLNYVVLTNSNGVVEKVNALFFEINEIANVNIVTEKNRFATRENIKAHISLEDGYTEMPVVSVTVTKRSAKNDDKYLNSGSFYRNPLLVQDYLLNNSEMDETTRNRVLALLSKHVDKELLAGQIKNTKALSLAYIPETRGLTLSGVVRNRETLQPVANHNIYLSLPFNSPQLHICKSRNDGSFIFTLNNVHGVNDIFICPENAETEDYEILITNPFSNEIPDFGDFQLSVDSSDIELLNEMFVNAQISKKFYPKSDEDSLQRERKNTFNIDNGKSTTLLSDFVTLKNMEELFTEIVPTAKYRKNKDRYSFAIFDLNGNITSENPLLLLDKIPVFDANKIMELDISLVEKVEVINRNYVLGENTFNGIIMISTKTKNFAGIRFPKSSIFIEYPTIQKPGDSNLFTAGNLTPNKRIPDFRTTLFWDSKVQLQQNGIDINFQSSDSKGTYDIKIKGFSPDGKPFYGSKQIFIE